MFAIFRETVWVMRRVPILALGLVGVMAMGACVPIMQDTADQIARQQARAVVNTEVQRRFPGVDARPVTDCVIENASAEEIAALAGSAVLGQSSSATALVATIMQRPQTINCMSRGYTRSVLGRFL
jgi:hypothetical protein